MSDKQTSLVAVVQTQPTYTQYAGITVCFGEFYRYNSGEMWRYAPLMASRYPSDSLFGGLHLTANLSSGQPDSYCWRIRLPEFETQYQYQDAQETLAVFTQQIALVRKAAKKLDAYDSEFGPCATFGEFAQRVLRGLNVDFFVMAEEVNGPNREWEFFPYTPPIKDIRQAIDSLIKQQHELWCKQPA